ncbi:gastrula zinc finger protein XlCGF26.1-like [Sergentomyia squamirostris]
MEQDIVEDSLHGLCRVCLMKNSELSTIFEVVQVDKIGELTLAEMIFSISGVQIQKEDGFPENVCETCRNNLLAAFEFRLLCMKSDEDVRTVRMEKKVVGTKDEQEEAVEEIKEEENLKEPKEEDDVVNEEVDLEIKALDENSETEDEIADDLSSEDEIIQSVSKPKRKNAKKLHVCTNCGKVFDKAYRLLRHMNIHNPEGKPYECSECKLRFATENNLNRHEIVHSNLISTHTTIVNDKPKIFQCIECTRVFNKQESLASHMKTHKEMLKQKEFTCEYCPKKFPKINLLTRHAKTHDECKSHKCNICGKTFALGGLLIDHINKHKGLKPHLCKICNKSFQQSCTLKDHMRIHNGDTPYLCSECGKSFNNGSNLRQHLIRHSGVKPFACTMCPSRFSCKGGLKSHMTTHTGLKPYVCDNCGHSFTKPYSLVKHKRIHTGERPYACDVCEMRFNSSDHVKRHMRTHTGEKPYKCKFCDRAFAQSNDLVKHMRSHVGDNTYKCSQCSVAFRLYSELRTHIREHFAQGEIPSDALIQKNTKGVNALPDVDGHIPTPVRINDAQTFLISPVGNDTLETSTEQQIDIKPYIPSNDDHLTPVTIHSSLPLPPLTPLTFKSHTGAMIDITGQRIYPQNTQVLLVNVSVPKSDAKN